MAEHRVDQDMAAVTIELWTSSFCGACTAARHVLARARSVLGDRVRIRERNVALEPARAEQLGIDATPTTVVLDHEGVERARATGVPTLEQALAVIARAIDAGSGRDPAAARDAPPLG